jgi:hypothetical protein
VSRPDRIGSQLHNVGSGSWLGENVSVVVPTSEHQRINAGKGSTSCDCGWN